MKKDGSSDIVIKKQGKKRRKKLTRSYSISSYNEAAKMTLKTFIGAGKISNMSNRFFYLVLEIHLNQFLCVLFCGVHNNQNDIKQCPEKRLKF